MTRISDERRIGESHAKATPKKSVSIRCHPCSITVAVVTVANKL